jgi:monoamine oxidase
VADPDVLDCVIVGGGVSGLYAAWRLTGERAAAGGVSGPPPFAVFEMSDRVGGRLETADVAGTTSKVELGAMRFWKGQRLVSSLFDKFGVASEPFPSDDLKSAYLRGVRLQSADFSSGHNVPYRLEASEAGKSPADLLFYVLQTIVPNAFALTDPEWAQVKRRDDLSRLGFWNVAASVLSAEAYKLLFDGFGIESALSNWNAGEALQLVAEGGRAFTGPVGEAGLFRPSGGWSELPDKLHSAYKAMGGRVELSRRLVSMIHSDDDGKGVFELGFAEGRDSRDDRIVERCKARRVILALPKHALALLRTIPLLGSPGFRYLVDSVEAVSAFRLYFVYDQPWWTAGWGEHGYSVTDLPVRQVFYGMGLGGTAADNDRILMASYADFFPYEFWRPLIQYPPELWTRVLALHHAEETLVTPTENLPPLDIAATVERALQQLKDVHGLPNIPPPSTTMYKDWGAYGGAWHAWKAGVPVSDFIPTIRQPIKSKPLFICGEAYSRMQGWVEGALSSVEKTLEAPPFNLQRPDWLTPSDYDLGP